MEVDMLGIMHQLGMEFKPKEGERNEKNNNI